MKKPKKKCGECGKSFNRIGTHIRLTGHDPGVHPVTTTPTHARSANPRTPAVNPATHSIATLMSDVDNTRREFRRAVTRLSDFLGYPIDPTI